MPRCQTQPQALGNLCPLLIASDQGIVGQREKRLRQDSVCQRQPKKTMFLAPCLVFSAPWIIPTRNEAKLRYLLSFIFYKSGFAFDTKLKYTQIRATQDFLSGSSVCMARWCEDRECDPKLGMTPQRSTILFSLSLEF